MSIPIGIQRRMITQVSLTVWSFMPACSGRIEMSAGRQSRNRIPILLGSRAARILVNMKTM
jgi:hypothetical protein